MLPVHGGFQSETVLFLLNILGSEIQIFSQQWIWFSENTRYKTNIIYIITLSFKEVQCLKI